MQLKGRGVVVGAVIPGDVASASHGTFWRFRVWNVRPDFPGERRPRQAASYRRAACGY